MENDEFVDEDDDDDNDFDSEDEDEPITLGFLEKPKNPLNLSRHFFPSKAGGLPAWLDPLNIPSGKSSVCDFCGDPLHFVLQVYAPVVEKESTFHRMLFVFMCPSMTCLLRDQHKQWKRNPEKPSRSVKVFRCRLPHINPFYSSECPKYDGSDKPTGTGGSVVVSPIHLPVVWMIALSFSHLVKCTLVNPYFQALPYLLTYLKAPWYV